MRDEPEVGEVMTVLTNDVTSLHAASNIPDVQMENYDFEESDRKKEEENMIVETKCQKEEQDLMPVRILCCNPTKGICLYFVQFLVCMLSFGYYFCYENPAALQDTMLRDLELTYSQFMEFYSWYAWPNVVMAFMGGFLVDRVLGIRESTVLFSLSVTIGQILFATGAFLKNFWVMCSSRLIFGIGCELLSITQSAYSVKWFHESQLNLAFGLQISLSHVGSTTNMNVMKPIYGLVDSRIHEHTCLGITLFIAGVTCVVCLIMAVCLGYTDKRVDEIQTRSTQAKDKTIRFSDVRHFPVEFWLLNVICVMYYIAVLPFIGLGLVFFQMKFGLDSVSAGRVNSLVYMVCIIASPVGGALVDKTGRKISWLIFGIIATIACHGLLAFTFLTPYVAMSILGVAYSILASSLWCMPAVVIKEHQLSTAYGIMQSTQCLGLGAAALGAGYIVDYVGYLILEIYFLFWLMVALAAAGLLYLIDGTKGGKLNKRSAGKEREDNSEQTNIELATKQQITEPSSSQ